MKKRIFTAVVVVVAMFFSVQVSAETWIIYKMNGQEFLYHTHNTIDCSTFVPGPGITIVDCWN